MPSHNAPSRFAVAGVGLAVVVTVAMAAIQWELYQRVVASAQWVTHTLDVQRQFDALLTTVTDAETGQRGFLLMRDTEYLAPYRAARAAVEARLQTLRDLTADNPAQQVRLGHLAPLVRAKFAELTETVDLASHDHREAALTIVASHRGRDLMDRIRADIHDGVADEERLLARRTSALYRDVARRQYVSWGLVALNAGALAVLLWFVRRLQRLEPLVTVCAWSKTIHFEDQWITFEEYLRRRFHVVITHGISPDHAARLMQIDLHEFNERR